MHLRTWRQLAAVILISCISLLILGCAQHQVAGDVAFLFKHRTVDVVKGDFRLVVWSAGPGVLESVGHERLRGLSWRLRVTNRANQKTVFEECGFWEGGYPRELDYSDLRAGVLRIADLTYDPRNSIATSLTPFIEETYTLSTSGIGSVDARLLLQPEHITADELRLLLDEVVTLLQTDALPLEQQEQRLTDIAAHFRNLGLSDPDTARSALSRMLLLIDGDAADSEMINYFMREIEDARDLRSSPGANRGHNAMAAK